MNSLFIAIRTMNGVVSWYVLAICLEKVFEEERNGNRKGNSRSVTTSYWPKKEGWKVKDWNDEILDFDLVYVQLVLYFKKVYFQKGIDLVIWNFELPSAFLCQS